MSNAVAYLVGQMIGATIVAALLVTIGKWRWVIAPYAVLFVIWALGYWIATGSSN